VVQSAVKTLLTYFRTVHPLRMVWHLVWMFCVLCMLSVTYIVTFHFQPVVELWQKSQSFDHFRHELTATIAIDSEVVNELTRLLGITQADRAYVFRYHNGIPAVQGVPFIFHTNTHEVIRPGVSRMVSLMQRIPSSINIGMNLEFSQNRCVRLRNIDVDTTSSEYWYFQSRGARHIIRCAFFTAQGDLIGFVGLDYLNHIDVQLFEAAGERLRSSSEAIGRTLSNQR
jgi:hypothetical protein